MQAADALPRHETGLLGRAERWQGRAQCIGSALQPGVDTLVARGLQLEVAQHVVAAARQAQLKRQSRRVTIERELEVRSLADDHPVLEEVDLGSKAGPAVAIFVTGRDDGCQCLLDLGVDRQRGTAAP